MYMQALEHLLHDCRHRPALVVPWLHMVTHVGSNRTMLLTVYSTVVCTVVGYALVVPWLLKL
jgi:hypothetical protein